MLITHTAALKNLYSTALIWDAALKHMPPHTPMETVAASSWKIGYSS